MDTIGFNRNSSRWDYRTVTFFQAVPDKELLDEIRQSLISIREVEEVHHLHLWSLDGENHVLTAHVVVAPSIDSEIHKHLRAQINQGLGEFNLNHTTVEIEFEDEECRDA